MKNVKVSVTLSHPTLWVPMDSSPPGSSVHGISQARILGIMQADCFLSEPPGKPNGCEET